MSFINYNVLYIYKGKIIIKGFLVYVKLYKIMFKSFFIKDNIILIVYWLVDFVGEILVGDKGRV